VLEVATGLHVTWQLLTVDVTEQDDELDESEAVEDAEVSVGVSVGVFVSEGSASWDPSVCGGGQSPMFTIGMHGNENLGMLSQLDSLKVTLGMAGRFQRTIPEPLSPSSSSSPSSTRTGTKVGAPSGPVVDIQRFSVHWALVTVSKLNSGGTVVITLVGLANVVEGIPVTDNVV
jgi:hypothetical protein